MDSPWTVLFARLSVSGSDIGPGPAAAHRVVADAADAWRCDATVPIAEIARGSVVMIGATGVNPATWIPAQGGPILMSLVPFISFVR